MKCKTCDEEIPNTIGDCVYCWEENERKKTKEGFPYKRKGLRDGNKKRN